MKRFKEMSNFGIIIAFNTLKFKHLGTAIIYYIL